MPVTLHGKVPEQSQALSLVEKDQVQEVNLDIAQCSKVSLNYQDGSSTFLLESAEKRCIFGQHFSVS